MSCTRERKIANLSQSNPPEIHRTLEPDPPSLMPALEHIHPDLEMRVGMSNPGKGFPHLNLQMGFLPDFPGTPCFRGFIFKDLSTREFPASSQRLAVGTLRDQHAAFGVEQRAGHDLQENGEIPLFRGECPHFS